VLSALIVRDTFAATVTSLQPQSRGGASGLHTHPWTILSWADLALQAAAE
jgi:hypothetical protein